MKDVNGKSKRFVALTDNRIGDWRYWIPRWYRYLCNRTW